MSQDLGERLTKLYRHATGPDGEGEQSANIRTAGIAAGLIIARVLTPDQVGEALENGVTQGMNDWTPEATQAALIRTRRRVFGQRP